MSHSTYSWGHSLNRKRAAQQEGAMEKRLRSFFLAILLQALFSQRGDCLSVKVLNPQLEYVVKGQTLTLQARIVPQDGTVSMVTWERETEGKGGNVGKVKVAEFPGKTNGNRVSMEQQGTILKLRDFRAEDVGVYTITVTHTGGTKSSANCTVKEYEAIHHVSVMVNASHSSLHCIEAWGTEPKFSWLHEKVAVTEAVGYVSADGTWLFLSTEVCGHFTCVVSNKLGHSSATYTAEPCEGSGRSTAVAVVCLVILILLAGVLGYIVWRRHRRYSIRRERLREPFEGTL
ncbi:uncharacterized protein LOC115818935 [Chanos chanos]|uniref:Uncharacterized protein LOC115818935 n=1 Tax=Chanos chanos TaxID=29144 RepID=A0A6J2W205_CHACN|nr:uncharacterized protein LOC115818935 [Chanos chanos]